MAIAKMQGQAAIYDPEVLAALIKVLKVSSDQQLEEVSVTLLVDSMAQDIHTRSGTLLACKGQPVKVIWAAFRQLI